MAALIGGELKTKVENFFGQMFSRQIIRATRTAVKPRHYSTNKAMSFFDLKAKDIKGHEVDFSKLKGKVRISLHYFCKIILIILNKVTLIVNVASKCGYTAGTF
jgi:hypothetical protein